MDPFGPPDSYLAGMLTSTLVYSVATVSALLLLGVLSYVAMVVGAWRGHAGASRRTGARPRRAGGRKGLAVIR